MGNHRTALAVATLALGAAAVATPARAAEGVENFYHGKTIHFIVGFGAGGGSFDAYARLAARYMPDHIPGHPSVIVQNMPGAGSLNALNYVMHSAPRDGTVIGLVNPVIAVRARLQPKLVPHDPRKMSWIGSMTTDYYTCGFWTAKPVTLRDLETKHFVVGSTATNGGTFAGDKVFESVLHLDFKVVPGYAHMGELLHAAERGEVQGFCGVMKMTLKAQLWKQYKSGQLQIPVRANLNPDPELAGVPNAFDIIKNKADRQVLTLLAAPWYFGRPVMAPPDLPKDRLAALRAGFDAAMKDPALLKQAEKEHLDIRPLTGQQVDDEIKEIYDIPDAVIAHAKPMFGVTK